MEYRHCSEQPAVEFQFEGSNRLGCDIILDYINTDWSYLFYPRAHWYLMSAKLFLQKNVGESDRHRGEHQAGEGDESAGELWDCQGNIQTPEFTILINCFSSLYLFISMLIFIEFWFKVIIKLNQSIRRLFWLHLVRMNWILLSCLVWWLCASVSSWIIFEWVAFNDEEALDLNNKEEKLSWFGRFP